MPANKEKVMPRWNPNYQLDYECPNCNHAFTIEVEPFTPGRFSGPPELCYPDEGGGFEPDFCPKCETEVDPEWVQRELEPRHRED
jgi:hypothetical protein